MHKWVKSIKKIARFGLLAGLVCLMVQSCGDDKTDSTTAPVTSTMAWEVALSGGGSSALRSVTGTSADNVYAVGDGGRVLHYDGTTWSQEDIGTASQLTTVWALNSENVYIAGGTNKLYFYDGIEWTSSNPASVSKLFDIHGGGVSSIFAVGLSLSNRLVVLKKTGMDFEVVYETTTASSAQVWAYSSTNVMVVAGSRVIQLDGSTWTETQIENNPSIYDIHGFGSLTVWATGSSGAVLRFNGNVWNREPTVTSSPLFGLYCPSDVTAFVVGNNGTILRYSEAGPKIQDSGTNSHLYDVWDL